MREFWVRNCWPWWPDLYLWNRLKKGVLPQQSICVYGHWVKSKLAEFSRIKNQCLSTWCYRRDCVNSFRNPTVVSESSFEGNIAPRNKGLRQCLHGSYLGWIKISRNFCNMEVYRNKCIAATQIRYESISPLVVGSTISTGPFPHFHVLHDTGASPHQPILRENL